MPSVLFIGHLCKQYSPRLDATERCVSSGAVSFAYSNFIDKRNKINIPDFPKNENGLIQVIRMGKSIRQLRIKKEEGLFCLCSDIKDTDQLCGF